MNHVVILAGGKGTRMESDLPKVLHEVNGVAIIFKLIASVMPICKKPTIIVGYKGEEVSVATGNIYHYVEQAEQLGTGHALMCAKKELEKENIETLIVLPGDHPLISTATLEKLLALHHDSIAAITLGTTIAPHFDDQYSGFLHYGRIIRDEKGDVAKIVEYKDASDEERASREVNLSYYCFNAPWLWQNIDKLTSNNAANEYYLTDMVKIAKDQGERVVSFPIENIIECLGINTPEQLKVVESVLV